MARICPKCGSQRVHRSHRRGPAEFALSMCGLRSRRCHECSTRFVALGSSSLLRNDVDRLLRKAALIVLATAAMFAVVAAVVWLSRRGENPATSTRLERLPRAASLSSHAGDPTADSLLPAAFSR